MLSRLISIVFGILITLVGSLIFSTSVYAATSSLGVNNGYLSACPDTPNCVLSQNADEKHNIKPIYYKSDRHTAKETLLKVLSVVPRTEVVDQTDDYIHIESKSRIFKFVDDGEFYFPKDENIIQMRSAARQGESDLGVNRRRLEQIRLALQDLDI